MQIGVDKFIRRLEDAGASDALVEVFAGMYAEYRDGQGGCVDWTDISPPDADDLVSIDKIRSQTDSTAKKEAVDTLAWIVLNGGIGTSMKMNKAKSLLPIKGQDTFIDLLSRHVLYLRKESGARLPLIFMNSYATRTDTLIALNYYDLEVRRSDGSALPLDFEQHRFPRIEAQSGEPFGAADSPQAWAPPGHGDIYLALDESGVLNSLLDEGFCFAFISNADNLGASPDPAIPAYMERNGIEFAIEVTPKTGADVKGGTLVRNAGRLELLEIAQVPGGFEPEFQDTEKFPAFNTNNIWIDLNALKTRMVAGGVRMPLIVNRKNIDAVEVVQLESAMGAAIASFNNGVGVLVGRDRFAPVKTTEDLLVRRSDLYIEGTTSPLEISKKRDPAMGPPLIRLDKEFYQSIDDFDARFPHPLSLVEARGLKVEGDVAFGEGVVVRGQVSVTNSTLEQLLVADNTVLEASA